MNNNKTILIVDDMYSNLLLLKTLLEEKGYKPILANNGKKALEYLETNSPDLILLDINMPVMSGFEVCEKIKKNPITSDIPVIFLTASVEIEVKKEGFSLGAVDFIPKIFQKEEIMMRIKTHLALREKELELQNANKQLIVAKEKAEKSEQKLQKSLKREKELANIVREAPMAIAFGYPDGRLDNVNMAFTVLTGYNQDELKNINWNDVLTPAKWRDFEAKKLSELTPQNIYIQYEKEYIHKSGKKIPIELLVRGKFDDNNNLHYFIGFVTDITYRKNAEKELAISRNIINESSTTLFVWKNMPTWPVSFVSQNVEKVFGYSHNDFINHKIKYSAIIHPNDLPKVIDEVNKGADNKDCFTIAHKPYRIITKSKQIKWINDKTSIIRNQQGNVLHFEGIIQDITESVESELKLKRSEKKFKKMLDANSDIVIISSDNFEINYMNTVAKKIFKNYSKDTPCYKAIFGSDEPCRWCSFMKNQKNIQKEVINKKDGKIYIISSSFLENEDGTKLMMSIYKDVTSIRKAELERIKFFNILDTSLNEVYILNSKLKFEYANAGALQNIGYSSNKLINLSLFDIQSDVDLPEIKKIITPLLSHRNNKKKVSFETTHKRLNGTKYPVEINMQLLKSNGTLVLLVNAQDITEKIKTEENLKKFAQAVYESPINIAITNTNGEIEFINKHFEHSTGYTQHEAIGINPRLLKSGFHTKSFYENMWQTISSGKVWHGELKNKHKNGTFFWEQATISPIKNKKGEIINYIALKLDITEKKKIEEELAQINQINKKIIEISDLGYAILTFEGEIIEINDTFLKISKIPIQKNEKFNITKINLWNKNKLKNKFDECKKTAKPQNLIINLDNYIGEKIWTTIAFSIIKSKTKPNILFTIKNISPIVEAQKELKISQTQLKYLTQIVNQPVFSVDNNKNITQWNRALEELSGYKKEEMLNKEYLKSGIINIKNKEFFKRIKNALQSNPIKNIELNFTTKLGKELTIILNSSFRSLPNEEGTEMFFIGQDITEMNKYKISLEKEVKKRTQELEKALKKEKELGLLKTKFVAMASHEFRTPLAAISFSSGMMKKHWQKISETDRNKKFDKIETQVNHMTSMLDDVLTYGKAESGKIVVNSKKINLDSFLKTIIEELYATKKYKHKINIIGDINNIEIFIDLKLGRNIFLNLFTNAMKFSPNKKSINFEIIKNEDKCKFKITDYGIGISEEDLKTIFIPFNRASNVETIQGTGLGLAIVKESIEMLNGKIFVTSKLGEGSCFTVELPICQK